MDNNACSSGLVCSACQNLSIENPSRKQLVLETAVSGLYNFFKGTVGENGTAYIPYLASVAIYIGIANLIGLLGFKPPTKDMNVTIALALMSIILIEVSGIRQKGTKGWLKSFAEPMPIILPLIYWKYLSGHFHCVCDYLEMYLVHSLLWSF